MTQGDLEVGSDPEKYHRHNHDKTMLWVDAGFTGLNYLYEVRSWLDQDIDNAEEIPGNEERAETRRILLQSMERIEGLIAAAEQEGLEAES